MNGLKMMGDLDPRKINRVKANEPKTGQEVEVEYTNCRVIGNGSFGVVFQADLQAANNPGTTQQVAIKKVFQDKRFKNRELAVMRDVVHRNIVALKYYFYSQDKDDVYLNLVLEYIPETIYRVTRHFNKAKQIVPELYVKLYMYQLFRSLNHIHLKGICHRDIKPQNLLVNQATGVLKICDFGSAKTLIEGEPNVSYICSRYYRAPELIFGATNYTGRIDIWSAGCVMAELILGQPLFPGESGIDQLVEIIKILGTPTREQIKTMNPSYTDHRFPQIKPHPFSEIFRRRVSAEAVDILTKLLDYTPFKRLRALEALTHPFFDELRNPNTRLPSGEPLPELFDFSAEELTVNPELINVLIPPHVVQRPTLEEVKAKAPAADQPIPMALQ